MMRDKIVLFDIDYTLFDTAFFKKSNLLTHKIYKEVIEVLDSLNKIATLGIFSEGNIDFQRKKLKETNIDKYFEKNNTNIFLNKLDEMTVMMERYANRKVFFVDDKLNILYDLKKSFPEVFTIWLKRGPFAKNLREIPDFTSDAEVENLSEIISIVRQN